jgi:hypothetical protein
MPWALKKTFRDHVDYCGRGSVIVVEKIANAAECLPPQIPVHFY